MTFPSSKSLLYNTSLPSFNVDKEKSNTNLNLTTIIKPESINHPSSTSTLPSPSSPTVPLHVNKNLPLRKRLTKDHHQQQQQLLQHNFQFKSITTSTTTTSSIPSSISPTSSSVIPLQWQPIETAHSSSSSSLQSKKETILFNSNNNNNEMKKYPSTTTISSSINNHHHHKSSIYPLPPLKPLSPNENNIIKSNHSIQSKHNNNNLIASSSPIKTNFIPTIIDSSSDFISLNKKSNNTNNHHHHHHHHHHHTTANNNNDINKKKMSPTKRKQMNNNDENKNIKKAKRGRPPLNNNNTTSVSKSSSSNNNSNETSLLSSNHILKNNNTNTLPSSSKSSTPDLYCICQKPYDIPRFMIACDRCDQWFHGECIGISEKEGEFVDLYFCESCSTLTGKKTSWKAKCSNPTCEKASRISKNQGHLSKYCSDHCGMQVARARLVMAEKKEKEEEERRNNNSNKEKEDDHRIDENNDNNNNEKIIFKKKLEDLSKARLSLFADRDDRSRLRKIKLEKQNAIAIIHLINKKYDFLQGLMKQQDESSSTSDNNNNNNNKQQDELCGFDSRLMWNDDQWDLVESIQKEPLFKLVMKKKEEGQDQKEENQDKNNNNWSICQKSKKKCQRHNGWMKLKSLEFEQEREEQFVILSVLARERKQIKTRINNRLNEMNLVNSLMNGTLVHNQ